MLREIFHPCVPSLVACSNIAPETPGYVGLCLFFQLL